MFNILAAVCIIGALIQPSYQYGKCPEKDGDVTTYYIDPTNCRRFYECNNGIPLLFVCPDHTVFDEHLNVCVHSPDGNCLVTIDRRLQESRLAESCPEADDHWTTFVQDEQDCTKYYLCSKGKPELQECARGLEFNSKLLLCDYPYRAGCHTRKSRLVDNEFKHQMYLRNNLGSAEDVDSSDGPSLAEQCPDEDGDWPTYLIDPSDCSRFYECSHGRPVPMQCPYGLYFSTDSLTCDTLENVNCDRGRGRLYH